MRRLAILTVTALAVAAAVVVLWRRSGPPPPRLVLLYAPCTVNKNFLSPYNPAVHYTPSLQEFSRDAVVFTRDQTEEGQSGIAYASLFSGLQSDGHGVFVHPARLAERVYLITEAFADNGYDTYFWSDQTMASARLNYAQGVKTENRFSRYYGGTQEERKPVVLSSSDERFVRILERLQKDPSYKAFIVTNFTVTHQPYSRDAVPKFCQQYPDECLGMSTEEIMSYADMFVSRYSKWSYAFEQTVQSLGLSEAEVAKVIAVAELLYKTNIFRLDYMFGDVVQAIRAHGLFDQSVIAFTSDHGEILFRDGAPFKWTHGLSLTPDDLEVPLMIHAPGVPPSRYEAVTRSIDLFPTLAGLSGIDLSRARVAGVDLSAALRGTVPPPRLLAFSHTSLAPLTLKEIPAVAARFPDGDARAMWVAMRDGDLVFKLTSDDGVVFQPRVYDWQTDRAERSNLYDAANAEHAKAVKRLAEYKAGLIESYSQWRAHKAGRLPSKQQEEMLRSLGYAE